MPRKAQYAVIDLFAGPGGLGEGFASFQHRNNHPFSIALSAEKDPVAQQTLELRSFVREFRGRELPVEYFQFLRGELSRDALFGLFPRESGRAREHSQRFELGESSRRLLELRIAALNLDPDTTVVIGGPPCQAYSVAGRSRNGAKQGWKIETDSRSSLYREYLHCLAIARPAAFVMENVRGMLSARMNGESVIRRVIEDLHDPAAAIGRRTPARRYRIVPVTRSEESDGLLGELMQSPSRFVVRAEDHGIPQARHRVILLGIAEDYGIGKRSAYLTKSPSQNVRDAIGLLPRLRSSISGDGEFEPWAAAVRELLQPRNLGGIDGDVRAIIRESARLATSRARPLSKLIVSRGSMPKLVLNHASRSHMPSDIHRYMFASAWALARGRSPSLSDFPKHLLPAHSNVGTAIENGNFSDRFRVQRWNSPSTTVVSHISKDGHYYIHPDPTQCRSLTVREAARLQTFPDDYFFCGPRTAQYHQVGNAVPVSLARQIAELVHAYLN